MEQEQTPKQVHLEDIETIQTEEQDVEGEFNTFLTRGGHGCAQLGPACLRLGRVGLPTLSQLHVTGTGGRGSVVQTMAPGPLVRALQWALCAAGAAWDCHRAVPSLPQLPVLGAGSRVVRAWGPSHGAGPTAVCAVASRCCALRGWREHVPRGGATRCY